MMAQSRAVKGIFLGEIDRSSDGPKNIFMEKALMFFRGYRLDLCG